MPYLEAIQRDYAADGVRIIAINALERGIGDPEAYLEGLGFPVLGILEGDDIAAACGMLGGDRYLVLPPPGTRAAQKAKRAADAHQGGAT